MFYICIQHTNILDMIQQNVRLLKSQNLLLAKFLSAMIYPAMVVTIIGFCFVVIAFSEPKLSTRILLLSPSFVSGAVFLALLYHVKQYLSNFTPSPLLNSQILWAAGSLILALILFPLSFVLDDKSIAGKMQIGATLLYFAFAYFMVGLSKEIAETRGVFIDGVEDFSRLHLLPTKYQQSLSQNLFVRITEARYLYIAVATPVYVFPNVLESSQVCRRKQTPITLLPCLKFNILSIVGL